ncbi:polycomb protein esc-like [Teleopsis dalmanni]|uniref:polycomb protein esc-like n=1 Tax=Teleopsis dalmanni TaxID=139649 RepID=UPI0018CD7A76|nr:polycomb protein esc-like [Teleopsis dalmanni]
MDALKKKEQTPDELVDKVAQTLAATTFESDDSEGATARINTSTKTTSQSKTPNASKTPIRRGKGRKKHKKSKNVKPLFKYNCHVRDDYGQPLLSVQFNPHLPKEQAIFAVCGKDRATIYDCPLNGDGGINVLQVYADPDPNENFHTCAWSYDDETMRPLLAVAGCRGIIRILDLDKILCRKHFIGHGHAINELKFHPKKPQILLSGSKDHSLRLWNIKTDVCVAIFGGVEGHRDEVLSVDFDSLGKSIMSSGMDHSLKLWRLDKIAINEAIEKSFMSNISKSAVSFPTLKEHFPDFTTRDIHGNYIDCVQWFGNFILSKSCENCIVCWKPGEMNQTDIKAHDSSTTIIHRFEYKTCDIWFVRFAFNFKQKILALGSQVGVTYVWELDENDRNLTKRTTLVHSKCSSTIRQVSFNKDGTVLVCVCDDGTIWRWDRIFHN